VKAREPGKKRPSFETVSGDSFHHATGSWNKLSRTIDRRNNQYKEHVVDENGRVVRDVEEPLSEHQGHGYAKKQKKTD